jgi:beta-N-acetylhexosaminidase
MINKKAIIFRIKSTTLNSKEKKFLKKCKPWGIILFSRNIVSINQLKNLVCDLKKTLNDKKLPILIDEEGGKVSRLNKIMDFSIFSQEYFYKIYKKNKKQFFNFYKIYVDSVCDILNHAGININTVPVLDVIRQNSHDIIGSRSFSKKPLEASFFGKVCIDLYSRNKVATVTKHIPGHGMANKDSHFATPIINENKKNLIKKDFFPFIKKKSFFAMTAHAVYKVYDNNVATHSETVIKKVIRKHIKFKGILISDDISMKSLKLNLESNALKALQAGCNLVLHCNGNLREMNRLSKVIPKINKFTQLKTSQFYKFLG